MVTCGLRVGGTIRHVNANYQANRVSAKDSARNRYVVIVKMLNSLLNG